MDKKYLGINVLKAAEQRVEFVFDNFPKIYLSFSGGKDSTVMLHLVMKEVIKRNRRIGLLFIDFEAQYKLTIEHIQDCFNLYADFIDPYWVALPIHLRNSVSQYQHHWVCWDPEKETSWVRNSPNIAITDQKYFPFYKYAMEFEDFVPEFGYWYGQDNLTACFVGIRTRESLNRWRTIASQKKQRFEDKQWTTWTGDAIYNIYPIYDWTAKDDWIYQGRNQDLPYNKLYDRMYQAGLTLHQMRICQPYGDDQRKGLYLFQIIEPETWGKVVARVNGANQGALYAQEIGNILGNNIISLPEGHTWQSFSMLLLDTMPKNLSEHYKNKIAVFLKWYEERGYPIGIPDDGKLDKTGPSWKRICKALLRNDYWCKGLSFSQHKSGAYEKYKKLMKRRRIEWRLMI
jgi:predicted phosphoadenosine phosphosulfate sulfurtransferase